MVLAVCAHGQDDKSLIGKWSMTSESNQGPIKWTLNLKESDGKLTAFLVTDQEEQAAKDFNYAKGVIKFKAPYDGAYYDIELQPVGDRLEGSWSSDDDTGKTWGTKNQ